MSFLSCLLDPFKDCTTKIRNKSNDSPYVQPTPSGPAFLVGKKHDGTPEPTLHVERLASQPTTPPPENLPPRGSLNILSNAHNTKLNNPVFNEYTVMVQNDSAAMDKLRSRTDPNASVDSSARQPAPTCHPKTRLEIRNNLTKTFYNPSREYVMTWLFGAAGTGKTAVGQTFSTECLQKGRLGAAFFFSRPNGRNRYETIVPSLAYQLSIHCPSYRPALLARIDHDPQILDKTPPVQLQLLIVEPLMEVRSQITTTFLMLLDGVDECGENQDDAHEREREQRELIKMIANAVRDYGSNLPLFWLLCSRPEQHLLDAFTSINTICQREDLIIDAQCREEVEVVLREGFAKIAKERGVISAGSDGWPSKEEFDTVEGAASGLHVFGAAILRDIEYSDEPVQQLKSLIPSLEHVSGSSSTRSIKDMDVLYLRILSDVPEGRLPTTLKIIGALITMPNPKDLSAQSLCNFLRLDPNDFFSALRKVHSVINIPSRDSAHDTALHLYHTSFSDFLTDASRSGKFFIEQKKVLVDIIKLCAFWHEMHSNLFHSSNQPFIRYSEVDHHHDPLPRSEFKWVTSAGNHHAISDAICTYGEKYCLRLFRRFRNQPNQEIMSLICNSDLRHMSIYHNDDVIKLIEWVYKQLDPSSKFIRTEHENDQDRILLTYLETVTKEPIPPARLPLDWDTRGEPFREYLFIGRDSRSIIVCVTRVSIYQNVTALNLDRIPDQWTIERYENSETLKEWRKEPQFRTC